MQMCAGVAQVCVRVCVVRNKSKVIFIYPKWRSGKKERDKENTL